MDAAGNIFGAGIATIFELSPDGQSGWNLEVLHTFTGAPKDGAYPNDAPVLDEKGNLYGTTYSGGIYNVGTVYKLSSIKTGKKKGTWHLGVLYSFKREHHSEDGIYPAAGIVFDKTGNIYGTTLFGGRYGDGTVFEIAAPGQGPTEESILWS